MVGGGILDSLSKIENFFKNMDSFPEMMKKQSEQAYKEYARNAGYNF